MIALETADDLRWLREVHLRDCVLPPFAIAVLHGNEDAPTRIDIYEHNHYQSPHLELVPDADGHFRAHHEHY